MFEAPVQKWWPADLASTYIISVKFIVSCPVPQLSLGLPYAGASSKARSSGSMTPLAKAAAMAIGKGVSGS